MPLALNVAMTPARVIGRGGTLPWHLPNDLKRFKQLTMGHHIVMGRKTYDSLGRPLPGRTMVVLTRQPDWTGPGATPVATLDAALALAKDDPEPFIIGGADLFALALPRVERLYLTLVEAEIAGDTFFPEFDLGQWRETFAEPHPADEKHAVPYSFHVYERR